MSIGAMGRMAAKRKAPRKKRKHPNDSSENKNIIPEDKSVKDSIYLNLSQEELDRIVKETQYPEDVFSVPEIEDWDYVEIDEYNTNWKPIVPDEPKNSRFFALLKSVKPNITKAKDYARHIEKYTNLAYKERDEEEQRQFEELQKRFEWELSKLNQTDESDSEKPKRKEKKSKKSKSESEQQYRLPDDYMFRFNDNLKFLNISDYKIKDAFDRNEAFKDIDSFKKGNETKPVESKFDYFNEIESFANSKGIGILDEYDLSSPAEYIRKKNLIPIGMGYYAEEIKRMDDNGFPAPSAWKITHLPAGKHPFIEDYKKYDKSGIFEYNELKRQIPAYTQLQQTREFQEFLIKANPAYDGRPEERDFALSLYRDLKEREEAERRSDEFQRKDEEKQREIEAEEKRKTKSKLKYDKLVSDEIISDKDTSFDDWDSMSDLEKYDLAQSGRESKRERKREEKEREKELEAEFDRQQKLREQYRKEVEKKLINPKKVSEDDYVLANLDGIDVEREKRYHTALPFGLGYGDTGLFGMLGLKALNIAVNKLISIVKEGFATLKSNWWGRRENETFNISELDSAKSELLSRITEGHLDYAGELKNVFGKYGIISNLSNSKDLSLLAWLSGADDLIRKIVSYSGDFGKDGKSLLDEMIKVYNANPDKANAIFNQVGFGGIAKMVVSAQRQNDFYNNGKKVETVDDVMDAFKITDSLAANWMIGMAGDSAVRLQTLINETKSKIDSFSGNTLFGNNRVFEVVGNRHGFTSEILENYKGYLDKQLTSIGNYVAPFASEFNSHLVDSGKQIEEAKKSIDNLTKALKEGKIKSTDIKLTIKNDGLFSVPSFTYNVN